MKAGYICLLLLMGASVALTACGNTKNKKAESNAVGNDKDEHGCIASAGYTWSEVQKDCIRLWEKGVRMESVADKENTAYIVFASDSLQVELFFSGDPMKYWIAVRCRAETMPGMWKTMIQRMSARRMADGPSARGEI